MKNTFLSEFELVMERATELSSKPNESPCFVTNDCQPACALSEEELEKHVIPELEDKAFMKFKREISNEPEQVFRALSKANYNMI